ASRRMCVAIVDTWRRLVRPYDQPAFRILRSVRDHIWDFDTISTELNVVHAQVERKHLLGQEARKRRGRALQLRTLGATTYAAAIRRDARNLTMRCITECVGEKNVRRYNQVLHAFKTSKNLKGKNPLKRKRRHWGSAFRKKRKVRAYDMFISHNFERGNGEPDAVAAGSSAERLVSVSERWRRRSPAQTAYYEGLAQSEQAKVDGCDGISFKEYVDRATATPWALPSREEARRKVRREAALCSMREMEGHNVWKCGAGIACMSSALRPDFVVDWADERVEASACASFSYDPRVLTASGPMPADEVCCMKYGGLCETDDVVDLCGTSFKNFYAALARLGLIHAGPLPVHIFVPGAEGAGQHVLYCRLFGKGEAAYFLNACAPPGRDLDRAATVAVDGRGRAVTRTWHLVFRNVLLDSAIALGASASEIHHASVIAWRGDADPEADMLIFEKRVLVMNESLLVAEVEKPHREKNDVLPFGIKPKKVVVAQKATAAAAGSDDHGHHSGHGDGEHAAAEPGPHSDESDPEGMDEAAPDMGSDFDEG
ncbi:unnamed protein product, partial [Prorocentrum cordatum]